MGVKWCRRWTTRVPKMDWDGSGRQVLQVVVVGGTGCTWLGSGSGPRVGGALENVEICAAGRLLGPWCKCLCFNLGGLPCSPVLRTVQYSLALKKGN